MFSNLHLDSATNLPHIRSPLCLVKFENKTSPNMMDVTLLQLDSYFGHAREFLEGESSIQSMEWQRDTSNVIDIFI